MHPPLPMLFVGDATRAEFHEIAQWLIERGAVAIADISSALDAVRGDFTPGLIVIAQPWPGRFSQRALESLRRAAPLARIVSVSGTWLEGETRTGRPWQGTLRAHWLQSAARIRREMQHVEAGHGASWSWPTTAGDDERLLSELSRNDGARGTRSGKAGTRLIAIGTRCRDTADALTDACKARAWQTVWLRDLNSAVPKDVDAVVWDAIRGNAAECAKASVIRAFVGKAPMIALVGFPRVHDLARWQAAGVAAVVSKPFLVDDLVDRIEQLCLSSRPA